MRPRKLKTPAKSKGLPFALIALLIGLFLLVLLLDYLIPEKTPGQSGITSNDGERLWAALEYNASSKNPVGFIAGDKVIDEQLANLAKNDYGELKKKLGLDYDFIIHFEDDKGNLLPIGNKYCIGSPNASIGGIQCG